MDFAAASPASGPAPVVDGRRVCRRPALCNGRRMLVCIELVGVGDAAGWNARIADSSLHAAGPIVVVFARSVADGERLLGGIGPGNAKDRNGSRA